MKFFLGLYVTLIALLVGLNQPVSAQQVNVAIAPIHSTANEVGHVLKATSGRLYQLSVANATASAGFVLVFDAAAIPGTGTVAPVMCRALPASGNTVLSFYPTPPAAFTTGIVAVVSSASVCTTYTTGVITGWFDAILQ